MEAEIALAVSARSWADVLHRFLADHGGARVRVTAMSPDDLRGEDFDVLLIDDSCSFLTPRLVHDLRRDGRAVVGVYDPDVFADGKKRLLECGVSDVVESDADPEAIVRAVGRVVAVVDRHERRDRDDPVPPPPSVTARVVAVTGASGGVGASEVAIALAGSLVGPRRDVVLVDGDEAAPSLAPRLGLPLHPNIRTAADAVAHLSAGVDRSLRPLAGFRVLTGTAVEPVRPRELLDVVEAVGAIATDVVVDVGSGLGRPWSLGRLVAERADQVVAVGAASPVGVVRLVDWLALLDGRPVDILVNRAPRDAFRRGEIVEEVTRSVRPASFAFLPEDPAVPTAAWDGRPASTGAFARAVRRWAHRFVGAA